jgi:signal transduction histidine kinase
VNLVDNGVKFTERGGTVTARCWQQGSELLVSVSDTGMGIPAEDQARIFERFYKTDRARASSGTGLGLAIAKHTVQAMGGRIWAESVEGKGSTFFIALPVAVDEVAAAGASVKAAS